MSILLKEIRACATRQALLIDGSRTMEFIFPTFFTGFQGHFPSRAILPGMVQIMAGIITAENDQPLILRKVCRAKFSRIIVPQEPVLVTATTVSKGGQIHAAIQISVHNETAAMLTLELETSGKGQ